MAAKWLQNGSEKGIWRLPGRLLGRLGRLGTLWHASGRLILLGGGFRRATTQGFRGLLTIFGSFWASFWELFGVFFCCFATSRSGPPVGGQKGPWAATFSGKNRDRGGERTVFFLLLAGLGEMVFSPVFPWSLLLAFRCGGVASKIAKRAESMGGSLKFACALFPQGRKNEDGACRKWAKFGTTLR